MPQHNWPATTRSGTGAAAAVTRSGDRSITATVLTVGGGQLVAQALTAAQILLTTRDDVAQLGLTATYYGIAMAAAQLFDAGASTRVLRDGARPGLDRGELRSVATAKPAALAAAVAAVGLLTGDLTLTLALGYAVVRGVVTLGQSWWQAGGHTGRSAAAAIAERAVALSAALGLCSLGLAASTATCLGLLAGGLVVACGAGAALLAATEHGRLGLRPLVGFGARFAGANLAANLVLLDSALLTVVAGAAQAGLYAVGARLLGPALILVNAGSAAALPAVAAGRPGAMRALYRLGMLTVAGLALLFAAAGVLVPVLAGPAFAQAVPPARAYLVAVAFVALAQTQVVRLQAAGDELWVSAALLLGVLCGLGGLAAGALLWHRFPALGASLGYAVACAVVTAALAARRPRAGGQRERRRERDVATGDVAQR